MLRTHARPHTMGVDMSCCLCDFYAQAHTISFLHMYLLCLYLLFRILKILLRTSNVSHSVDALIFMIVLSQICSQVCYVYTCMYGAIKSINIPRTTSKTYTAATALTYTYRHQNLTAHIRRAQSITQTQSHDSIQCVY